MISMPSSQPPPSSSSCRRSGQQLLHRLGRKKVTLKKIENHDRRMVCFSKRRAGLFKKEGNKPYSFGNPSVENVIAKFCKYSSPALGEHGNNNQNNIPAPPPLAPPPRRRNGNGTSTDNHHVVHEEEADHVINMDRSILLRLQREFEEASRVEEELKLRSSFLHQQLYSLHDHDHQHINISCSTANSMMMISGNSGGAAAAAASGRLIRSLKWKDYWHARVEDLSNMELRMMLSVLSNLNSQVSRLIIDMNSSCTTTSTNTATNYSVNAPAINNPASSSVNAAAAMINVPPAAADQLFPFYSNGSRAVNVSLADYIIDPANLLQATYTSPAARPPSIIFAILQAAPPPPPPLAALAPPAPSVNYSTAPFLAAGPSRQLQPISLMAINQRLISHANYNSRDDLNFNGVRLHNYYSLGSGGGGDGDLDVNGAIRINGARPNITRCGPYRKHTEPLQDIVKGKQPGQYKHIEDEDKPTL